MSHFGTYVYRDGELVEKHLAGPLFGTGPRSSLPMPMVISDTMDAVRSMADGKYHDSKSHLRKTYKDRGYTEIGNEAPRTNAPVERPNVKNDLMKGYRKVKEGYKPASLEHGILPT